MPRISTCLVVLAALLASTSPTLAANPPSTARAVDMVANQEMNLVGALEHLEDRGAELTFAELVAGARADDWQLMKERAPNYGFTSSAHWQRVVIANSTSDPIDSVLAMDYQLLDHVDIYVQRTDGSFEHHALGDRLPYDVRPLPHTQHAVPIRTQPGQTQWIYIRVATTSSMQIGARLTTAAGYLGSATKEQLLHGIYYGIMIVMVLYNLFLFFSVRHWSYLWYVGFVSMFCGVQASLDGVAARYLFADWPGFANLFTPLSISLALLQAIVFTQLFLETKKHTPRVHKALHVLVGLLGLGAVLALVAPYSIAIRYATGMSLVVAVVSESIGIVILLKGYRPARFFVLAWTSLIVGTFLYSLMSFGVLPANGFTVNVQRIGSALEVTLLSFALGDRIKLLERANELAREAKLRLERDIAVTSSVQQLFLPPVSTELGEDVRLAGFYQPADQCGGDWWWYERPAPNRLRILLGDVTGHGPGAAMLTGAVAASYRSAARSRGLDVDALLHDVDQSFKEIGGSAQRMSLVAIEIDLDTGDLEMWSAGAPPVFVQAPDGSVTPILAQSAMLGSEEIHIARAEAKLEPGARLFAFSDGLPELMRPNGRALGYKGVERILGRTRSLDLVDARGAISDALDAARLDEEQLDDYSFVLVELEEHRAAA